MQEVADKIQKNPWNLTKFISDSEENLKNKTMLMIASASDKEAFSSPKPQKRYRPIEVKPL